MTPSTFVAPHLRESVFRDYEPLITQAVAAWPNESSFPIPRGVAPTTFVANFRNAILSLKQYSWPTTVDTTKLWSLTGQYCISQDTQGTVWFRQKHRAGRPLEMRRDPRAPTNVPPPPVLSIPSGMVPWRDATAGEITALCVLIHFKRLHGPFFVAGEVPLSQRADLEAEFDVALVFDEARNITTIT